MSSFKDFARAFAKQADADFFVYNLLSGRADVPACQRLHFLQMACEKLCKAHLYHYGSLPDDIATSHAHVANILPLLIRDLYSRVYKKKRLTKWVLKEIRRLAREIELLAPAVLDGGSRPDNCEYPWQDQSGIVRVPAEHDFATLNLAPENRAAVELLALLPRAIREAIEMS